MLLKLKYVLKQRVIIHFCILIQFCILNESSANGKLRSAGERCQPNFLLVRDPDIIDEVRRPPAKSLRFGRIGALARSNS